MSEPVNQMHKTLRVLSEQDPTLQRAIAFVFGAIKLQTYEKIKADPGVRAWVADYQPLLAELARKKRAAYAAANATASERQAAV